MDYVEINDMPLLPISLSRGAVRRNISRTCLWSLISQPIKTHFFGFSLCMSLNPPPFTPSSMENFSFWSAQVFKPFKKVKVGTH
jgi:hypothetical protein